jgi:adenine-specific DNA-methyltransferase
MGSKRAMLENGLGELLAREMPGARRFVDLFSGSAAVAGHVAQRYPVPVFAYDLQNYSAVLARSVVARRRPVNWLTTWQDWQQRARVLLRHTRVPATPTLTRTVVNHLRRWSGQQTRLPITRAYGGHYFSAAQAVCLDALRRTLPEGELEYTLGLASLIHAASECAAAPGHTAQPFQPTRNARRYIAEAWNRDIFEHTRDVFALLADQVALRVGRGEVRDANIVARTLREGDLVFLDPPYSGVHYSRFYHVLETVARGEAGEVFGAGRYPATELRPRSRYSLTSQARVALNDLLQTIALRHARAILTFPDHDCSNGLSGRAVREIAATHFRVQEEVVESRFSTLGGTGDNRHDEAGRAARQNANELMLVLGPR